MGFPRCRTRDDIVHIYQQATRLAKIGERKGYDTLEYPRCIRDAKGEDVKDAFTFWGYRCCFVKVLLRYGYLAVSSLYVAHSDEFCTTHCVDMRLNSRHRPCLANKELGNSSPVIDTETWWSLSFCNKTYGWSLFSRCLLDNANWLHIIDTFINHFLYSWICLIGMTIQWFSVFM